MLYSNALCIVYFDKELLWVENWRFSLCFIILLWIHKLNWYYIFFFFIHRKNSYLDSSKWKTVDGNAYWIVGNFFFLFVLNSVSVCSFLFCFVFFVAAVYICGLQSFGMWFNRERMAWSSWVLGFMASFNLNIVQNNRKWEIWWDRLREFQCVLSACIFHTTFYCIYIYLAIWNLKTYLYTL